VSRRPGALLAVLVAAALAVAAPASGKHHHKPKTIAVPKLLSVNVFSAYNRLHRDGFRVSMRHGFELDELAETTAVVESISPAAGERLLPGAAVTLSVGCPTCAVSSPGTPPLPYPQYTVPDFVGRRLKAVERWLHQKVLYLTRRVGPLNDADAETLFDNYRIARQHPAPGKTIELGIAHANADGSTGSFKPTPLVVWLSQQHPHGH
jgi:beta-lactam-binding protein with PASTA domain